MMGERDPEPRVARTRYNFIRATRTAAIRRRNCACLGAFSHVGPLDDRDLHIRRRQKPSHDGHGPVARCCAIRGKSARDDRPLRSSTGVGRSRAAALRQPLEEERHRSLGAVKNPGTTQAACPRVRFETRSHRFPNANRTVDRLAADRCQESPAPRAKRRSCDRARGGIRRKTLATANAARYRPPTAAPSPEADFSSRAATSIRAVRRCAPTSARASPVGPTGMGPRQ